MALQILKYFTIQIYNLQKNPLKETPKSFKILYKSITNLKFQHKPKISSFKTPCIIKNRPRPKSIKLLYTL